MKIDLTKLVTNLSDSVNIDLDVNISNDLLASSDIKRLDNTKFVGKITKDFDNNLVLTGILSGIMILPDNVTLEDTSYEFKTEIEEELSEVGNIERNSIDILDYLWQNILVEVPLKVHNSKNDNITLKGDGWRFMTEDELNNRHNYPLSDLSKLLDKEGSEE